MQDVEYIISQYLDGDLSSEDRQTFERQLESDPAARELLNDYRKLDTAMKALPMPTFDFQAMAGMISSAIDQAEEERAARYRMPSWIRRSMMPLALAASMMIVAGIGIELFTSHRALTGWPAPGVTSSTPTSSTVVAFETDKASGPAEATIAIGPAPTAANDSIVVSFSNQSPETPAVSHVTVASGMTPVHDTRPVPSFDME